MPIHGGITVQTLSTNFGTNLTAAPFSGTTTYDFYSPPLGEAVSLQASDKGGGIIYLRNTGTTGAADFTVTGRMRYFDYDPATGVDVVIVDTGESSKKNVNYGQTVPCDVPNVLLPSNITIPAGHMIHLAMTISVVSGNPGNWGRVIYNGDSASTTVAWLPKFRSVVLKWSFDPSVMNGVPPTIISLTHQPDGAMAVLCGGTPGATYSIQASPSMQPPVWTTIAGATADSNGLFSYDDDDAGSYPSCFYRIVAAAP